MARGKTLRNWLVSYHSFPFQEYTTAERRSFGRLEVLNEDWLAAGGCYSHHSHKTMRMYCYIVSGNSRHQDTIGNDLIIPKGALLEIRAGDGIVHSEGNADMSHGLHFIQFWLRPLT
ncbi:MAG: pirin family protein, partial [Pseudomonadota bacterium]